MGRHRLGHHFIFCLLFGLKILVKKVPDIDGQVMHELRQIISSHKNLSMSVLRTFFHHVRHAPKTSRLTIGTWKMPGGLLCVLSGKRIKLRSYIHAKNVRLLLNVPAFIIVSTHLGRKFEYSTALESYLLEVSKGHNKFREVVYDNTHA